jgi:hypothetical protein
MILFEATVCHLIFCYCVVAAFFEFLPTRTINTKEPKTVWVKCADKDKERATVMLLGDSEGSSIDHLSCSRQSYQKFLKCSKKT